MAQLLPDCRLNYYWIGGSPNTGLPAQRMAEYSPFKVTEDNHDRSYMWVYHAGGQQGSKPVFIYEYTKSSGRVS